MALVGGDLHLVRHGPLERGQTVRDRPRPDYDPNGIRLGAFNLFPALLFDVAFDDNIRAVPKDSDVYFDDTIFVVVPELALESDWSRHELGGGGGIPLEAAVRQMLDEDEPDDIRIAGELMRRWIGQQQKSMN